MSRSSNLTAALLAVALTTAAHAQQASSIGARVAAAPADGVVEMRFPARAGVCGDGRNYIALGRTTIREGSFYDGRDAIGRGGACVVGPVRVVLTLRGHEVSRVRPYVGGSDSARVATAGALDLGVVDPRDAAAYLLGVAAHSGGRAADEAILSAVLADRAVVWPALLAIARDSSGGHSHGARGSAGFWLSRFAAAALAGHPEQLADYDPAGVDDDDDDGKSVKGQAVFALSQLPRHEGVPPLIEVARTNRDTAVRNKALFWLGQSGDPRAFALFEQILRATASK